MKEKHLRARIAQCLAIAACSSCSRRKFGAVLVDPTRNVVLMDGYNGPPRGAKGALCGDLNGTRLAPSSGFCTRDGLRPEDVEVRGPNGVNDHDVEDAWIYVKGRQVAMPIDIDGKRHWKAHGWRDECLELRARILADYPPIPSGERIEVGCHHAEWNVITNCAARGVATAGAHLVITGEPCRVCSKLIHHAGITKVIVIRGGYTGTNGVEYLRMHGVEVQYVDGPTDPRTMGDIVLIRFLDWLTPVQASGAPEPWIGVYHYHLGSYMRRWVLRHPWGEVQLHQILRADRDAWCHDHPFDFTSIVLRGGYSELFVSNELLHSFLMAEEFEQLLDEPEHLLHELEHIGRSRSPGSIAHYYAESTHRIVRVLPDTWTLVFAGPRRRSWGFWVGREWIPHATYLGRTHKEVQ